MKKIIIALICLLILMAVPGILALSSSPVASVGGVVYTSLQEAIDAAALGQTKADRVVLLLHDVDLGGDAVIAKACDITLNLNGHTITGTAEALIVLKDGARLTVADAEAGLGTIRSALGGAGCAILVEDAGSILVINAGTIETLREGDAAVRCAADSTVVVNGGSVSGIANAGGTAAVQDEGRQEVVQYALTIGSPPLKGAEVSSLSTRPGPSRPYGRAVTNGSGVIHVWLPEGQTFITAKVGCSVYEGRIRGGKPYAAVLTSAGFRHDFSGDWYTDGAQHWKVCQKAGCGAEEYRKAHFGGTATCTEPALCSVCGIPYGAPLGHDFETGFTIDIAPTCTEAGLKSHHCTRCDEVNGVTVIPATGHSFSPDWSSDDGGHWHDAACGHDETYGYAAHLGGTATCLEEAVCLVCGVSYGEPLGHDFETGYTIDIAPTCTGAGSKSYHCTRCDELAGVKAIPATGHTFSPGWSSDDDGHWHDAACGHDETDGYAAHLGGTATCLKPALCSVCGISYGAPLGHDFDANFTIDIEPTCSNEGGKSRHCTRCEAVTDVMPLLATDHPFSADWTYDATAHWHAATCEHTEITNGYAAHLGGTATCLEEALCSVCGISYGAPLGHDFEADFTIDIVPDCGNEGGKSRHCTRCEAVTDVTPLLATDHPFSADWTYDATAHWHAATCEHTEITNGYAAHIPGADDGDCTTAVFCSVCGCDAIPATTHIWSGWQMNATEHWKVCINDGCLRESAREAHYGGAATCTAPALCSVCGVSYGAPLGHDFEADFTIDIVPDCSNEGGKSRHCTRCEAVTDVTPLLATDHPFSADWTYDATAHWHAATCEHTEITNGYAAHTGGAATCTEQAICSVCGISYGPPLEHAEYTEYLAPTCTTDGVRFIVCTRCEEMLSMMLIPATGHTFSQDWSSDDDGHWHDATCGHDVKRDYMAHIPVADDGNCTTGVPCGVCGHVAIPAHEHNWGFWLMNDTVHWRVCRNAGCVQWNAPMAHSGGTATCTQGAKCSVCEYYNGEPFYYGTPLGHDFEANFTVDAESTCTTPGLESRHCTRCSVRTDVTDIPATGHSWDTWRMTAAANCKLPGTLVRSCLTNPAHSETQSIPIDTNAHAWDTGVITTPVTCTTPGLRTYFCIHDLAHFYTEIIPILPHTHTVNFSQPANGFLLVASGGVPVISGTSVPCKTVLSITAIPAAHYHLSGLTANGSAILSGGTWTVTDGNAAISASMSIDTYTIAVSSNAGVTFSPSGTVTADHGSSKTITITPNAGYVIQKVFIDGADAGVVTSYTFENVTANHTLSADIAKVYDIVATAGEHGQISPSGNVTVFEGSDTTFTITPDMGYKVIDVLVDGASMGAVTSYKFQNVLNAHTISVSFAEILHIISATSTSGGSVTPPGASELSFGQSCTVSITPDPDYMIYDVKVDGVSVGRLTNYTFSDNLNHTIAAEFRRVYTISASVANSAGTPGGSISPSGLLTVIEGESIAFTATPDADYVIARMSIDGVNHENIGSYTFDFVTANHSISASFNPLIAASAGTGGSISPSGSIKVECGASRVFSITPDGGYCIADVLVDGVSQGAVQSYTFSNVTVPHTIQATFIPTYRISETHGAGGTITPGGYTEVPKGANQTYTITPNEGYHIDEVKVDGVNVSTVGSYTFQNVTTPHTIGAKFGKNSYAISFAAMTNGSVSSLPNNTAQLGTTVTLTVTPESGYQLKTGSLKVNGTAIAGTTFAMPAQDVIISAEFELRTYAITVQTTGSGTIVSSHSSASFGTGISLTVTPALGYRLASGTLKANGTAITGTTFLMPNDDVLITAHFEVVVYSVTSSNDQFERNFGPNKTFYCAGPFADFEGVNIDGVATSSYTASASGSGTSITISYSRLDECSYGPHTITFRFLSGIGTFTLQVVMPSGDGDDGGFNRAVFYFGKRASSRVFCEKAMEIAHEACYTNRKWGGGGIKCCALPCATTTGRI